MDKKYREAYEAISKRVSVVESTLKIVEETEKEMKKLDSGSYAYRVLKDELINLEIDLIKRFHLIEVVAHKITVNKL